MYNKIHIKQNNDFSPNINKTKGIFATGNENFLARFSLIR